MSLLFPLDYSMTTDNFWPPIPSQTSLHCFFLMLSFPIALHPSFAAVSQFSQEFIIIPSLASTLQLPSDLFWVVPFTLLVKTIT